MPSPLLKGAGAPSPRLDRACSGRCWGWQQAGCRAARLLLSPSGGSWEAGACPGWLRGGGWEQEIRPVRASAVTHASNLCDVGPWPGCWRCVRVLIESPALLRVHFNALGVYITS